MVARDGEHLTTSGLVFFTGELPDATWDADIRPLFQERCQACHSADANTPLPDAAAWERNIDNIIDEVSSGAMPLGGDPLTVDEIALIRGWKRGGYP